jgi:enterochelin esterase family protein
MLQSGSFFTPASDPQEAEYGYFGQVTGFVATVLAAQQAAPGAPEVAMTCGTAEENFANNLAMRDHLRAVGMNVSWGEVRQGHTWTCWRDSLDPHLGDLLTRVWA